MPTPLALPLASPLALPVRLRPLACGALLIAAACDPNAKSPTPTQGATSVDPGLASDTAAVRLANDEAQRASRPIASLDAIPTGAPPGCRTSPPTTKHWEEQSTVLLDSVGGQLVARARATLTGYPYLRRSDDASFRGRDLPIGHLTLDREYRGVPAGTYCIAAAFVGETSEMGQPNRWSLRLYATSNLGGAPLARRLRFEGRRAEEAGPEGDPRIPVRFVVEAPPSATGGGSAGAAGSSFLAGALVPRVLARMQSTALRAPSAWFRCGSGCCSGSTYFE